LTKTVTSRNILIGVTVKDVSNLWHTATMGSPKVEFL